MVDNGAVARACRSRPAWLADATELPDLNSDRVDHQVSSFPLTDVAITTACLRDEPMKPELAR